MDWNNQCQLWYWNSYSAKRVMRFFLESLVKAFAYTFVMAYIVKFDLHSTCTLPIDLAMITGSLSLFDDSLTKASVTNVKKIMIGLQKVTDSYNKGELDDAASISSEHNLADQLIKIHNQMYFMIVLNKAKIDTLYNNGLLERNLKTLL